MKVFVLHHNVPLPRKFYAINLFGIVLSRERLDKVQYNHEYIHSMQQREMLYLFFYLWYLIEWTIRLVQYRKPMKAYYKISFEREAYSHEYDSNYKSRRRCFAWLQYLH